MTSQATCGCTTRSLSNNTLSGSPTTLFSLTTVCTLFSYWTQLLQSWGAEVEHQLLVFHQSAMKKLPSVWRMFPTASSPGLEFFTETDGVKTSFELLKVSPWLFDFLSLTYKHDADKLQKAFSFFGGGQNVAPLKPFFYQMCQCSVFTTSSSSWLSLWRSKCALMW